MNNIKSHIWRTLTRRKRGVLAIEWTITSPFTFVIIFFSIMFAIFTINYYTLNHTAFSIAQELNMGDTGYAKVSAMGAGYSDKIVTKNYDRGEFFTPKYEGITWAPLTYTPTNGNVFGNAAKYYVQQSKSRGGFTVPYVTIKSVDCRVYDRYPRERYGFNVEKGQTESGDMIVVSINYSFLKWLNFTVKGYAFII